MVSSGQTCIQRRARSFCPFNHVPLDEVSWTSNSQSPLPTLPSRSLNSAWILDTCSTLRTKPHLAARPTLSRGLSAVSSTDSGISGGPATRRRVKMASEGLEGTGTISWPPSLGASRTAAVRAWPSVFRCPAARSRPLPEAPPDGSSSRWSSSAGRCRGGGGGGGQEAGAAGGSGGREPPGRGSSASLCGAGCARTGLGLLGGDGGPTGPALAFLIFAMRTADAFRHRLRSSSTNCFCNSGSSSRNTWQAFASML
mmetsp:Transcript_93606/g.209632  ORF Transcript_93606/g.209632 Transcript_93606/m.209632 type:complete len:255 (-) Transcript_93606:115-879(-)